MLAGTPPFGRIEPHKILAAHLTQLPPPIGKRRDDVPSGLERLEMQCLEKDPGRRPARMADVLRALQNPELLTVERRAPEAHRDGDRARSPIRRLLMGIANAWRGDLRTAVRSLARAPSFTLSAVLCLTLGIGATAAIASAVDRALLQPLPFRDPARLVTVYRVTPHANTWPFAGANYRDLAARTHEFESLAAVATNTALVSLPDGGVQADRARVTGNFFETLGVHALEGRLIAPSDDDVSQNLVVVISEEFWRNALGGDPQIVSRVIQLDGERATVIGVLPAYFGVPHGPSMTVADVWVPMRFTRAELEDRRTNYLRTFGRLAAHATPETAGRELAGIYADLGSRLLEYARRIRARGAHACGRR